MTVDLRHITMRPDTCDLLVFDEVWVEDVYRLNDPMHAEQIVGRPALDLGANVGAFTLRALAVGASRVHAVEPDPANAEQLRQNCAAAGVGAHVTVHQCAVVGDSTSPETHGGIEVRTTMIDSLLRCEPEWGVVKCDIEGGEFDVFRGVDSALLAQVHYITMEFHAPGMGQHLAWIESGSLGTLVEKLTETHHVQTLGAASRGGQIYARRY
jgi:hypothetical protein